MYHSDAFDNSGWHPMPALCEHACAPTICCLRKLQPCDCGHPEHAIEQPAREVKWMIIPPPEGARRVSLHDRNLTGRRKSPPLEQGNALFTSVIRAWF
jgi:hypothetical protein